MVEQRRKDDELTPLAQASHALGAGLTWVGSTGLFLYLGWLADKWLGTLPLFALLGAFVGGGAGFYYMYHEMVIVPRERARRERDEQSGDGE